MGEEKIISGSILEYIESYHSKFKSQYFHYTKNKNIFNIFGNRQIRLGEMNQQNDRKDRLDNAFSLCLTSTNIESIPFWYLYSGVRGDGIRIRFTPLGIRKIIGGDYYYCSDLKGVDRIKVTPIKRRWYPILYYERWETREKDYAGRGLYRIKIDGSPLFANEDQIIDYNSANPGFSKTMEWSYEKEWRLVVDLDGEEANSISNPKGIYVSIDGLSERISVLKGPFWQDSMESTAALHSFFAEDSRINKSVLGSELDIDLCKDCLLKHMQKE